MASAVFCVTLGRVVNCMSMPNPYETAVGVNDAPNARAWPIAFAVSATIAFVLINLALTGNDLSVYFGMPSALLQNVLPAFVFAILVGRFNGDANASGSGVITLAGRVIGGCILGTTVIPTNRLVVDYLYLVPLPHKIAEVLTVLLIPVITCTLFERMFFRLLRLKQTDMKRVTSECTG